MKDIKGVIYILTNPSFPQFVKIGYADDVDKRLAQLNRSECVPYAFRLYAYYKTPARLTDLKVHEMIDILNPELRTIENINGKKRVREFYAMTAEDAYKILYNIASASGLEDNVILVEPTKEEEEAEDEAEELRSKPPKLAHIKIADLFDANLIKNGDEVYIKVAPDKIGIIESNNKISIDGNTYSFNQFGKFVTSWKAIDIYEWLIVKRHGKTLDELREILNENQSEASIDYKKLYVTKKPSFKDLVDYQMLKPGDVLIIKNHANSDAQVIDNLHVKFSNKLVTPNEWGKIVFGHSNNIYATAILKSNNKTLEDLRAELINKAK